jgi:hypothetical protein
MGCQTLPMADLPPLLGKGFRSPDNLESLSIVLKRLQSGNIFVPFATGEAEDWAAIASAVFAKPQSIRILLSGAKWPRITTARGAGSPWPIFYLLILQRSGDVNNLVQRSFDRYVGPTEDWWLFLETT